MPSYLSDPEIDPQRLDGALSAPLGGGYGFMNLLTADPILHGAADFYRGQVDGPGANLDPETANRDYGVKGYLTFEQPVGVLDAERQSAAAHRRSFNDFVTARSNLNPLEKIGGSMAGAMLDPGAAPLMFAPELLGMRAGLESLVAARGVGVLAKTGRVASAVRGAVVGGAEGLVGTGLYEAADYGLGRYDGDPEATMARALQNTALGGVFGAALGGSVGALFHHAPDLPPAVRDLPEESRLGATAMAIDAAATDKPVDIAGLVDRETQARQPTPDSLGALDEGVDGARIPGKMLDEDVAVTTRGTEIPVRYALVELADLVTSHDNDLSPNPDFPSALQPRDRSRAGSQAGNHRLESELNPKLLMKGPGAETGAPIAAPDGTVESGNGRVIALRRSSATGSDAYSRYRAELQAQGFDTTDMTNPVLVRLRTQPMDGEGRAALAREMNAAPTEAFGPAEQAMADARTLDDATLSHLDGTAAGDRAFARAFIAKAAPDQQNAAATASGALSAGGQARIKAALVARAYGDPGLVAAVFETADPNIKALGAALTEAAPQWARMRSLAQRGEIPAELDLTPQLQAAVALIRHARDNRIPVHEFLADRLGQGALFAGHAVDAETEAFLRLMFRDAEFRRPRSGANVGWALKDYARQASEVTPGPNLFGETPDGDATLILQALAQKFARDEPFPEPADLLFDAPGRPAEPPVVDLRPDAGRGPGDGGLRQGGVEDPQGPGPRPGVGKTDPLGLIDPELKQLAETDLDGETPTNPKEDPSVIAEAIRAAAFCLREGGA